LTLRHFEQEVGTYSELAAEYYDSQKHPTCANFRELSVSFISQFLLSERSVELNFHGAILETGAGLSVFCEPALQKLNPNLKITLQDSSEEMLSHSKSKLGDSVDFIHSDARKIPACDQNYDIVISSLADPYNDDEFWKELRRIISYKGLWIVTAPSFDWANAFRTSNEKIYAEFLKEDGTVIHVPSYTYRPNEMINRVTENGFRLIKYEAKNKGLIRSKLSYKIDIEENPPVMDCYVFVRQDI